MKVFDSLKTMSVYHKLFNALTSKQQEEFHNRVFGLFDAKQISVDGEYDSFKITEKDVVEINNQVLELF